MNLLCKCGIHKFVLVKKYPKSHGCGFIVSSSYLKCLRCGKTKCATKTKEKPITLLPCPFCGSDAFNGGGVAGASCSKEGCVLYNSDIPFDEWNTRSANAEIIRLRKALQEIVDNPHGAACHNYQRAKKALEGK